MFHGARAVLARGSNLRPGKPEEKKAEDQVPVRFLLKEESREDDLGLSGGPAVKTLHFQSRSHGFHSWLGN